ncbi:MAG: hypothetical protein KKD63_02415 [Proteobacteria bacterium]|nr:hypothetical protein [Desulfobulbaceae bacterium]MBU4151715.1 hypothetical protein [Pseudomonadota bacterium]MDP2107210.1 hypothetical protein [Desulfobulbaceae bacterium]
MKKIMALAMALAFTAGTVVVAHSFTCDVKAVEGTTVTLECKDKDTAKIEVGQPIKVSPNKKKAVEGC